MAKGNGIIVSSNPQGKFLEGIINGTPKPGTIVQIDVSEGLDDNGRLTFEPYNAAADGARQQIFVLLPDHMIGQPATTAYVTGTRCFVYCPIMGEELNMVIGDVAGTADDHSFGEFLIVDDTTGELVATTGTPESEPFQLLEDITDPAADTLAHVMYTGY